MIEAAPWNLRLKDIAPEIHIGREEVGSQVLEELYPADDVEHDVDGKCCDRRHHRRLEEDGEEHRDGRDHQKRPGAGKTTVEKTPERLVARDSTGLVNQI